MLGGPEVVRVVLNSSSSRLHVLSPSSFLINTGGFRCSVRQAGYRGGVPVGFLLPCGLAIHQNEDSVVHCSLQHHFPGWQAPRGTRRARPQKTRNIGDRLRSWRCRESLVRGKSVVLSPVAVARGRCRTVFRHDLAPRRPRMRQAPRRGRPPHPTQRQDAGAATVPGGDRAQRGAPGSPHPRWDMGQEARAMTTVRGLLII